MVRVTVKGTDKPKGVLDLSNRPNYILVDDYDNDIEISYNKLDFVISSFWKTSYGNFFERLKEYLTHNLSELGYKFNSEHEFLEFMEKRVTRITSGFRSTYELYLDFNNPNDKGTLIGTYSDSIQLDHNADTVRGAYILKIGSK